jgi:magnesium chelatase family protein
MFAATTSVALVGGDARQVDVEVHVGRQKEAFKLSGLPDTAVREAKDRVRAAVVSSGVRFPNRTVTVNLAPADLPKGGTDYDLPIALALLAASREIPSARGAIVVGELALDGSVRAGAATLGAGVLSARTGLPCLVSREAAPEVAAVPGATAHGVATLAEAVEVLRTGFHGLTPARSTPVNGSVAAGDMSEIRGQQLARRALEVAAAGGHHLLFHGPPGGGKTMLARRLPGILPPLSDAEAVEVALVYAAAGLRRGVITDRPFRSPHHTASRAALVGGGSPVPVPGEASLAHRGVLFLDELAEFPRSHLDTLRQPLEDGVVTVARRGTSVEFPSSFHLVAATNPCPCGFHGDHRRSCECRPAVLSRYRLRVSGPLLDRLDLVVKVGRLEAQELSGPTPESSESVRERVLKAVEFKSQRGDEATKTAIEMIRGALAAGLVTARGAARVRRVARTIADLAQAEVVDEEHVAESLALRGEW